MRAPLSLAEGALAVAVEAEGEGKVGSGERTTVTTTGRIGWGNVRLTLGRSTAEGRASEMGVGPASVHARRRGVEASERGDREGVGGEVERRTRRERVERVERQPVDGREREGGRPVEDG